MTATQSEWVEIEGSWLRKSFVIGVDVIQEGVFGKKKEDVGSHGFMVTFKENGIFIVKNSLEEAETERNRILKELGIC